MRGQAGSGYTAPVGRLPAINIDFRSWRSDGTAHALSRNRISQGGHRGQTDANGFIDRTCGHLASGRRGRAVFLEQLLGFRGLRNRRCRIRSRRILRSRGSLLRFLLCGSLFGLRLLRVEPARVFPGVRPNPPSPKLFCCFREPPPSPSLAIVLPAVRLLRLPEPHPFLVELRAPFRIRISVPVLRLPLLHTRLFRVRVSDIRLRLPGLRLRLRVRLRLRFPSLRCRTVW